MTYKDLVFKAIGESRRGVFQAIVRFGNGFGLSILRGPGTLTSAERPYEAAVISFAPDGSYSIIYPEFTHHDVLPYLTADQVSEYMIKVSAGSHITALEA